MTWYSEIFRSYGRTGLNLPWWRQPIQLSLIHIYGNELLLSDVLGTDSDLISRPLEDLVDQQLLREALEKLPEREKNIVVLRFGLAGRREKTQKEVADLMGISQSYISRLEKRIMTRLRREILKQTS